MDTIQQLGRSVIQHGRENDRIYLMEFCSEDYPAIVGQLNRLAQENGYSKIFTKIPEPYSEEFLANGYLVEARVPSFFSGKETGLFLSRFLSKERQHDKNAMQIEQIITLATSRGEASKQAILPDTFSWRRCEPRDADQMSRLYARVFTTYPFPIYDAEYLRRTMAEHVIYFGIWHNGEPAALSSAETYPRFGNVEMTDFATLPEFRGQGLASFLLSIMDEEMRKKGYSTAYTIARAISPGMNITFARAGYQYGGTLIRNTNIAGQFESMNVWHKQLPIY